MDTFKNKIKNNIMKAYKTWELKSEIKTLVANQIITKAQRKTVSLIGERTIDPEDAQYTAWLNKNKLRLLYAAYGVMRGKTFLEIENKNKEGVVPLSELEDTINSIVEKYAYEKEDELVA